VCENESITFSLPLAFLQTSASKGFRPLLREDLEAQERANTTLTGARIKKHIALIPFHPTLFKKKPSYNFMC
jgi:hypothetical protein